jgi:hypothetical protein
MSLKLAELKRQRKYLKNLKKQHICLKCRKFNPKNTLFCSKCWKKQKKRYPRRAPVCKTVNTRHIEAVLSNDQNSLFYNKSVIGRLIDKQC